MVAPGLMAVESKPRMCGAPRKQLNDGNAGKVPIRGSAGCRSSARLARSALRCRQKPRRRTRRDSTFLCGAALASAGPLRLPPPTAAATPSYPRRGGRPRATPRQKIGEGLGPEHVAASQLPPTGFHWATRPRCDRVPSGPVVPPAACDEAAVGRAGLIEVRPARSRTQQRSRGQRAAGIGIRQGPSTRGPEAREMSVTGPATSASISGQKGDGGETVSDPTAPASALVPQGDQHPRPGRSRHTTPQLQQIVQAAHRAGPRVESKQALVHLGAPREVGSIQDRLPISPRGSTTASGGVAPILRGMAK